MTKNVKIPKGYYVVRQGKILSGDILFASESYLWKDARIGVDIGENVSDYSLVARKDCSEINKIPYGQYS